MRAQVGHCDSSLSSNWRDDAPQVICISYTDFLDGAQLPCLILRHLLEGFLYSVTRPFRDFQCSSENAFVFFPVPPFNARKDRSKYSLAGDSCCRWPCIPVCLSFTASSELFYSSSFLAKICPHLSYVLFFSIIFHNLPRCAFFLHKLVPLPLCQWLVSSCHQRFVATLLA